MNAVSHVHLMPPSVAEFFEFLEPRLLDRVARSRSPNFMNGPQTIEIPKWSREGEPGEYLKLPGFYQFFIGDQFLLSHFERGFLKSIFRGVLRDHSNRKCDEQPKGKSRRQYETLVI